MGTDAGPPITDTHGRSSYIELSGDHILVWIGSHLALRLTYEEARKLHGSIELHLILAGVEL